MITSCASPESRHNRFGRAVADDFVERYTANSIGLENIVYGYFDSHGTLRAVGELRPVNPQRLLGMGGEMEGAFSVETGWRKQGIGSDLMRLDHSRRTHPLLHDPLPFIPDR